jgi:hypothetical protein
MLGMTLHTRYKDVTLVGHDAVHGRVAKMSQSLGMTPLHTRYKYVTLNGHDAAHTLQIWHIRWA